MLQELKGKKLLIIGGIRPMVEVAERAHELGITVYVTDYLEDSPAKKVADRSFMTSATDIDAVVALIKEEGIDGIYTGNVDLLLPYYAEICEKAGLPCYGTAENFRILNDKKLFKDRCRLYDVPVIEEYKDIDSVKEFPVLIKPVDSSGSRGISVCYSREELEPAVDKALRFSRSGEYLIERYMQGDEVVLYYYFQDGKPVFAGMCDRYVIRQEGSVAQLPTAYIFPSRHTKDHLSVTDAKIKDMFRGMGMTDGTVFLQGFMDGRTVRLYEPGYRTNGAREQYIFGNITGIDSVDMLLHFALTGKMWDSDIEKMLDPYIKGKLACKLSPLIGKGTVSRIEGLEEANRADGVITTVLNNDIGDRISDDNYGTLRQVAYRTFIVSDSAAALGEAIDKVQNTVIYYDENDRSMMLEGFDTGILLKNYE